MLLSEDPNQTIFHIQKYDTHSIQINTVVYQNSIIITDQQIIDWPVNDFSKITEENLKLLFELKVDLLLFGTGPRGQLLPQRFLPLFQQKKIGVESMDTGAACRTYMALASEGRPLAAALIIENTP